MGPPQAGISHPEEVDRRVNRFLTFRLDKYAAEYAEKRRRLRAEKPQVEPAEAEAEATEAKEA